MMKSVPLKSVEATPTNVTDITATFGGTADEVGKKKPSERIRVGGQRDAYTRPSQPVMQWLRSPEIVDAAHPLGKVSDLSDDELEQEVFLCGVPILELVHLAAGSYQLTSPWAVLGNLICTSAMDAPHAEVETGVDAHPVPLNFLVAIMGVSGKGKGSALRTPLAMGYDLQKPPQESAASGEAIIRMFYEQIDVSEGGGKTQKLWARREGQGVWVNWDEIDAFVAKSGITGQKGNTKAASTTLGSTLRSLFIGGKVGDKALSRDGDTAYLEAGTYRFVCTIQGQPDRMGALVNDDTGGTLQRLLILPTLRDDDKPTLAQWQARKAELCRKLGHPSVAKVCPRIAVWGPHGTITVTNEVADLIGQGRLDIAYDDIDPVDGHIDSIRIRLAALFAGWVAGFEQDAVIDANAWWWASCVLEKSRRTRIVAKNSAGAARDEVSRELGEQDAVRRHASEEATEEIEMKTIYPRVQRRVCDLVRTIPLKPGRPAGIAGLATQSDIGRGLSGAKQRTWLNPALHQALIDGLIEEVKDGKTMRYRTHPNAANAWVGS